MPADFSQNLIFGLCGGLGLFLYGMKILSEGLQKVADDRLRTILSSLTDNRLLGAGVGMLVAAIVQSSSATTIMVIGFVNAGLLSLVQSLGVILGANIGTTVTAQLIAFNISQYALPAIGLGALFKLFAKNRTLNYVGEVVLGFGLLFFGLLIMKQAFAPLKSSEQFHHLLLMVTDYRLLAVLVGAGLTMLVQSSSAVIGVTLALASSGLLPFETSVALILGENIGTTVTTNLAAIGTGRAARRAAFCHFFVNLVGVGYMLLFFDLFTGLVDSVTPGDPHRTVSVAAQAAYLDVAIGDAPFVARHIANTHTLFNVINVLIFLPLIGLLAKLSAVVVRESDTVGAELQTRFIDKRVLNTPPIALGQARSETRRMAQTTLEMVKGTNRLWQQQRVGDIAILKKSEDLVDFLQKEITDFLVILSQKPVSSAAQQEIGSLMHMVNDIERIGDHCEHLWQLCRRKIETGTSFTDIGFGEIVDISEKTAELLAFVVASFDEDIADLAERARSLDNVIDALEKTYRSNHISRLNTGECSVRPGLIYIDMLHNYEKIGDHALNVADRLAGDS
ncbi:MAG: Na/Pi cotransporter [Desulfuromonas sp.]|nr:MAG: Na/Pi cotransporter [Desulfuromonas sp.]